MVEMEKLIVSNLHWWPKRKPKSKVLTLKIFFFSCSKNYFGTSFSCHGYYPSLDIKSTGHYVFQGSTQPLDYMMQIRQDRQLIDVPLQSIVYL